jgi:hypothetical protein
VEILKCNCCGKEIKKEQGIQKEDVLAVFKEWGYFSGKDMERHRFIVCEACYDNWVSGFKIPPEVEEQTEAL